MDFISGLELSGYFYNEAVRPLLEKYFPGLRHAAARLDFGSDVLGFDTSISMDHGWGPKVMLFLSEADDLAYHDAITSCLANELPLEVHGFPTHFGEPLEDGGKLEWREQRPIHHGAEVTTLVRFFKRYLGIDPTGPVDEIDWLLIPQQRLRTVASGRVYHDDFEQLEGARQKLKWYPQDVWLYLLANQWRKIDQEEPFMGRSGDVGDEIGSHWVAARLVGELMRLCFLIERVYAPYTKWFGTGFARLACAPEMTPWLKKALEGSSWQAREQALSQAYIQAAEMTNALGLAAPLEAKVSPFHGRPYQVIHSGRFFEALYQQIQSPAIRSLPRAVGAVWQFVDSTDVLDEIDICRRLASIYKMS
jgi:Domain of unknown function (DUF4037)